MQFLLDTNVFIRILNGSLPNVVRRRVLRSQHELLLSILSPWEIALKPALKKSGLTASIVKQGIADVGARILPVTLEHTAALYDLPWHHDDPFDRMIIAQALTEQCAVVSSDQRFPLYEKTGLKVIWD